MLIDQFIEMGNIQGPDGLTFMKSEEPDRFSVYSHLLEGSLSTF